MRITPAHIEQAFRRLDDFYRVQRWDAHPPTSEPDMKRSMGPVVALLASAGLDPEAVAAFRRRREGGSDAEFVALLVGVVARDLAEDSGAG